MEQKRCCILFCLFWVNWIFCNFLFYWLCISQLTKEMYDCAFPRIFFNFVSCMLNSTSDNFETCSRIPIIFWFFYPETKIFSSSFFMDNVTIIKASSKIHHIDFSFQFIIIDTKTSNIMGINFQFFFHKSHN